MLFHPTRFLDLNTTMNRTIILNGCKLGALNRLLTTSIILSLSHFPEQSLSFSLYALLLATTVSSMDSGGPRRHGRTSVRGEFLPPSAGRTREQPPHRRSTPRSQRNLLSGPPPTAKVPFGFFE